MADYVTLLGAEDVLRAGHAMRTAADDMNRAAGQIDYSIQDLKRFLDDYILRLEALKERLTE